jgi:hypothetical protein
MLGTEQVYFVNPSRRGSRKRRANPGRRRAGPSAKQLAWRRKFGQMYGGGRKRRTRMSNPKRRTKNMRSIKRYGKPVSRASWRASGYRRNPIRRRRSYRRNPIGGGRLRASTSGIMAVVTTAAKGAVGATLTDVVMGQLLARNILPAQLIAGNMYPVTKSALAIGLGLLAQALPIRALRDFGVHIAQGSLTVTLNQAMRMYVPASMPMGYYTSGQVLRGGRMRGMGRYLNGADDLRQIEIEAAGPAWTAQGAMSRYLTR